MSEHRHQTVHQDVDAIIKLAQTYDLDALTVVDGEFELSITRRDALPPAPAPAPTSAPVQHAAAPAAGAAPAPVAQSVPSGAEVKAPMIGVFYRAGAPDAPPFVQVGDRVRVGQTLCILEAMKLMNEITSDYNGVVTAVLVENSDLVTIGQTLFTISP